MVFAKTSKAAARLSEQVRNKTFQKEYLAIVDGKFEKFIGTLEDYLLKTERTNTSRVVKEGTKNSKYAKLDYEVLKYNEEINLSLVKILLHTGRHHQIRVQFSSRGYPLLGDKRYGKDNVSELGLCAYKLSFTHPVTKEIMEFIRFPKGKIWNFKYVKGKDYGKEKEEN